MSNEREVLASSLPPEDGSPAAAFEKGLTRKGPGCPLTADLILLAERKVSPDVAVQLEEHLEQCDACRASFTGFFRALEQDHEDLEAAPLPNPPPPADSSVDLRAPTLPLAPPTPASSGYAVGREWDVVVRRVADLFVGGASADQLLEQTGLPLRSVLTALCEARNRALPVVAPFPPCGEQKSLLDLLRLRSQCLHNVTVRQSRDPAAGTAAKGSWTEPIKYFGCEVAPLLLSLLSQASHVGVAWGPTVAAAIAGLKRACESPPVYPRGPLVCIATLGGLVGERKVRAQYSSSILASRLAETLNGDWEQLYTLQGLEAFIASYLGTSDEIEMTRKRIACFPNYQAIFGGPSEPGVIDQLNTILTSCGNAHHYDQFWMTELPRLGMSPEKLNSLTHGNIGGVLLEREDLDPKDKALFADIARRWTGITRRHYEQCARRKPGVVLLAMGHNKADVVLKCVELGLVTELIIDEDLAKALWDKVDPQHIYPRTLEAVLCRQVSLERAG